MKKLISNTLILTVLTIVTTAHAQKNPGFFSRLKQTLKEGKTSRQIKHVDKQISSLKNQQQPATQASTKKLNALETKKEVLSATQERRDLKKELSKTGKLSDEKRIKLHELTIKKYDPIAAKLGEKKTLTKTQNKQLKTAFQKLNTAEKALDRLQEKSLAKTDKTVQKPTLQTTDKMIKKLTPPPLQSNKAAWEKLEAANPKVQQTIESTQKQLPSKQSAKPLAEQTDDQLLRQGRTADEVLEIRAAAEKAQKRQIQEENMFNKLRNVPIAQPKEISAPNDTETRSTSKPTPKLSPPPLLSDTASWKKIESTQPKTETKNKPTQLENKQTAKPLAEQTDNQLFRQGRTADEVLEIRDAAAKAQKRQIQEENMFNKLRNVQPKEIIIPKNPAKTEPSQN